MQLIRAESTPSFHWVKSDPVSNERQAIAARLSEAFELQGFPLGRGRAQAIAAAYDVSRETARKWLDGETVPEVYRLSLIAQRSGLYPNWIWSGQLPKRTANRIEETAPTYGIVTSALAGRELDPAEVDLIVGLVERLGRPR